MTLVGGVAPQDEYLDALVQKYGSDGGLSLPQLQTLLDSASSPEGAVVGEEAEGSQVQ